MKRTIAAILCAIFGHSAVGPDTENEFCCGTCGKWKPFYQCRRCVEPLMWNCEYPNGWLTRADGNFSGMQGPIGRGDLK